MQGSIIRASLLFAPLCCQQLIFVLRCDFPVTAGRRRLRRRGIRELQSAPQDRLQHFARQHRGSSPAAVKLEVPAAFCRLHGNVLIAGQKLPRGLTTRQGRHLRPAG